MKKPSALVASVGLSLALVAGLPAAMAFAAEGDSAQAQLAAVQSPVVAQASGLIDISEGSMYLEDSQMSYTGEAITPYIDEFSVWVEVEYEDEDGDTYTEWEDYYPSLYNGDCTITYKDSKGATVSELVQPGEYKVVVTGNPANGYTGSLERSFTIYKGYISSAEISLAESDFAYTGQKINPGAPIVVAWNNDGDEETLVEGRDYTVKINNSWDSDDEAVDPVDVGTYYLHVIGAGGWLSDTYTTFQIYDPKDLNNASVSDFNDWYGFTGDAISIDEATLDIKGTKLVKGRDYTTKVEFWQESTGQYVEVTPQAIGEYRVAFTGIGGYTGTYYAWFEVYDTNDLSSADVTLDVRNYAYTGSAVAVLDPVVKMGDKTLVKGTDYTVLISKSYGDTQTAAEPKDIGAYYLHVIGTGAYKGSNHVRFRVYNEYDITNASVDFVDGKSVYAGTGSAINPAIIVRHNGKVLTAGTDYAASWWQERTFNATTGQYVYTAVDPKEPGSYNLRIEGLGQYKKIDAADSDLIYEDKLTIIDSANLADADIVFSESVFAQTGKAITPDPVVLMNGARLVKGTDYNVSYAKYLYGQRIATAEPTEVGDYRLTITGAGKYAASDKIELSFEIAKGIDISGASVLLEGTRATYTGSAIAPPTETVYYEGKKLTRGTDYTVKYLNSKDDVVTTFAKPGSYDVVVEGAGAYIGSVYANYYVSSKADKFSGASIEFANDIYAFAYTGKAVKPQPSKVTVNDKELALNKDYKIVGYRVGYYYYDDEDDEYYYRNNAYIDEPIETGTYSLVLVGLGDYAGKVASQSFSIVEPNDLALATVDLNYTQYYTGSAVKPQMAVTLGGKTLKNGTDYTLIYRQHDSEKGSVTVSSPTEKGSYTVQIFGKGDYVGSRSASFYISQNLSIANVKLSKASYAYNGKSQQPKLTVKLGKTTLKADTDYRVIAPEDTTKVGTHAITILGIGDYSGQYVAEYTIVPAKAKITKVKKAKKAFTVKWKKVAKENGGYEIRYSLKKGMSGAKTVTVKKAKTTSKKIKKLKSGKKYYVQVRTFKKVNGETYYGAWSAKKSVKVK